MRNPAPGRWNRQEQCSFCSRSACCTWLYTVARDLHTLYLPCKAGTVFISAQLTDLNRRDTTWLVTISSYMQSQGSKSGQIWWCRFTSAPPGGFDIMVHQQGVRLCSGKKKHSGLQSARKRPKGATLKVGPAFPAWAWRRLSRQPWKLVLWGWSLRFPSHGKTIYFSMQGIYGIEEEHVACPSSYSMKWMLVWLHLVTYVSKDFIIK